MKEVFCRLSSLIFSPLLLSAANWLVDKQEEGKQPKNVSPHWIFHRVLYNNTRHATFYILSNHARMYSYVRCLVEKESSINTTVGSLLPFEDPTQAPMSQTRISIRDTVSEFCITIYFYKNNSNTITKVRSY